VLSEAHGGRPAARAAAGLLRLLAERQAVALGLVALVYAVLALTRPADVFWSPNQGNKLLQVWALLDGRPDLSIEYAGRALDPRLSFRPYVLSYVAQGGIQVPWPAAWAFPSGLLYAALGGAGLLVLPAVGGLLGAWGAGRLAERAAPGSGWVAVLLAGLATPLLVYSTLFWEHAAAAGLFGAGLALLLGARHPSGFLAGCAFGLAVAWRPETLLFLAAALLPAADSLRRLARRGALGLALGFGLVQVPTLAYNLAVLGSLSAARMPPFTRSIGDAAANVARLGPGLPADFLVGHPEAGAALAEPVRWAPLGGLLLLGLGRLVRRRRRDVLVPLGLALAGLPAVALLVAPPPGNVAGFLIAAPFLAVAPLLPRAVASTPSGRALAGFAILAPLAYALVALLLHRQGVAGSGAQWGPRFLLPAYLPLAALSAAILWSPSAAWTRPALLVARSLVVLAVLFQLVGLVQIDRSLRDLRERGQLLGGLPPGPIVISQPYLADFSPGLVRGRAIFCARSGAALREWADLALRAGEREFWFVDREPPPGDWFIPGATAPARLAEQRGGGLQAIRYDTTVVRTGLLGGGPVVTCAPVGPGREVGAAAGSAMDGGNDLAKALNAAGGPGVEDDRDVLGAGGVEGAQALGDLLGLAGQGLGGGAGRLDLGAGEGDEGAGGAADPGWVAADVAAGGLEAGEGPGELGRVAVPDGVVGVGVAGRQAHHARAAGADPDRWAARARTARAQLALAGLVVLAGEVDFALAQQPADDGQRLLEAAGEVVEGVAEGGVFGLLPAGPQAEDQAAAADLLERVGHLGQQGRVAKAGAGDERAEGDALGDHGQRAEQRPGLVRAVAPAVRDHDRRRVAVDQVVGHPEGVEADRLGHLRHVAQLGPADHPPGVAAQLAAAQHQPQLELAIRHHLILLIDPGLEAHSHPEGVRLPNSAAMGRLVSP
jgi:hypothetical protein